MLPDFDIPTVVSETATVVVSITQPTADGVALFIAITEGETKSSFFSSQKCNPLEPISFVDMGLPQVRHLINLVVDTNLPVDDQRLSSFTVYPNPSKDFLKLSLPPSEIQRINLYDSSGKKLECSYHNNVMDVSMLSEGIYFLSINTTKTVLTKKFIKQ
ncbi:MAG: T9SS type A sorting domain-containing protein [Aequorivita sp.]